MPTWVVEGHQQEGATLLKAVGASLDDGEGTPAGSGDLLKHTACRIHDEHQCWWLLHTEEPAHRNVTNSMLSLLV